MTDVSLSLIAVFAAMTSAVAGAALAEDAPLALDLGTRHRFVENSASPYPAAGCIDHRALMFVVSETQGDDPAAAKLLAERDCRPLVPDAVYVRCGPGGWAYPAKRERISYASYCRVGVKDLPLYVLDSQMQEIGDSKSRPR